MITKAQVKTELNVSGTTYDDLIDWLILSVESVWDEMTNKTWAEATYSELYDGTGKRILFLGKYPVTAITNVTTGFDEAFKIKNTTTGATASISINSTGLVLTLNGVSDSTVTFSANTTLTDIVSAINALGSNWSAEIYTDMGTIASTELLPAWGQSCADGYIDLYVPDEYLEDLTVDASIGRIVADKFPKGYQNIRVKYTAGYSSSTCPDWLAQTLIRQVGHWYLQATEKRWHVSSMHMSSGGTISYNKGGKYREINLLPDFKNMAKMHRRINV